MIDLAVHPPRPMDATLGGYPWLPRMIDKSRAAQAGTLGGFSHPCPVDRICLARLRMDASAFGDVCAAHDSDEAVLAELQRIGIPPVSDAWFDPIGREAELARVDAPAPVRVVEHAELPSGTFSREFAGHDHGAVGVTFLLVEAQPGDGPGLHRHPYDEVIVVQEGRGDFTAGDEQITVGRFVTEWLEP